MQTNFIEENDQTQVRREHLAEIAELVGNPYPSKFSRSRVVSQDRDDTITAIVDKFRPLEPQLAVQGERPAPEVIERINAELNAIEVRASGRLATPPRVMGKAAFVHLSDGRERLQIYVKKADVVGLRNDAGTEPVDGWQLFQLLDHGDIIGISGYLFLTKTGELSVHVRELQFLAKALLPMPDKLHGISDPELRQRRRYADLIAGSLKVELEAGELTTRQVFERRTHMIREMRRFLDKHDYVEVETPMLTPLATGATAKPFVTHHNALDMQLYARIAPELYLKRLVVGGFERVYELNRNFRNEGLSIRHNPEFTMLEFYCAYLDAEGMMSLCEELLATTIKSVTNEARFAYGDHFVNFGAKFERLSMKQAIARYWPSSYAELGGETFDERWLDDALRVKQLLLFLDYVKETTAPSAATYDDLWQRARGSSGAKMPDDTSTARGIQALFEEVAETHLIQPTFVTDFPKSISPLSKASATNIQIAERFELYISGMEVANGFSELNDPVEQFDRFVDQTKQREGGDDEAMEMDEDYLRALAYGMPPAAGIGIGIDRLVMILTNRRSIRDVILFPHLRPERKSEAASEED
ncbi:MAG: lysine--tRNA ligase [Pyrinomonadaceae bacterium]